MSGSKVGPFDDTFFSNLPVCTAISKELADTLVYEEKVWAAKEAVDRQQFVKYMTVEMTIPCVLHMDSRVVETLLHNLLVQAIAERYGEGNQDSKTRNSCKEAIEEYMNDYVYGDKSHAQKGQWSFPEEDGVVLNKTLSGSKARKVMQHLANLADLVFAPKFDESAPNKKAKSDVRKSNNANRSNWRAMMNKYNRYWKILNTKDRDVTEKERDQAHFLGNGFFAIYVDMFPDRKCH